MVGTLHASTCQGSANRNSRNSASTVISKTIHNPQEDRREVHPPGQQRQPLRCPRLQVRVNKLGVLKARTLYRTQEPSGHRKSQANPVGNQRQRLPIRTVGNHPALSHRTKGKDNTTLTQPQLPPPPSIHVPAHHTPLPLPAHSTQHKHLPISP